MKIVGRGSVLCKVFIEMTNINPCSGQEGAQKEEMVVYEARTKIQTQIKNYYALSKQLSRGQLYSDLGFLEIIQFSAA